MKKLLFLWVFASIIITCCSKPHSITSAEDVEDGDGELESNEEGTNIDKGGDTLERGAVYGHSTIAANPHVETANEIGNHFKPEYAAPSPIAGAQGHNPPHFPMDFQPPYNPAAVFPQHFQHMFPPHQRQGDYAPPPLIPYHSGPGKLPGKHNYQNGDDLRDALEHLDYVKWLVASHAAFMETGGCSRVAEKGIFQPYGEKGKSCHPHMWKKCNCMTPAAYSDEGRGNCNLGATKAHLKVWCYVDDKNGDPAAVCPDSKPSKTKPGYFWSRMACIT